MMSTLRTKAGIKGFKTNHSLRATAASRLYHHGIDEQLKMERTGHKSLDGVRSYKRTSEDQQAAVSSTLQKSLPAASSKNHLMQMPQSNNGTPQSPSAVLSGLQLSNGI